MKEKKIAFLFPGQGAQYPGMAKDFVDSFAIARELLEEADDRLGRKLSDIVLKGPQEELTETRNSQAGIFVASMAIFKVLQHEFPHLNAAICAGLSLGEYSALCASGRLSFADCLQLVQYRGQFMNDACETTKGTMAVILGLEAAMVEQMVKEVGLPNDLWVANFNCPGQVVISGTAKGIEAGSHAAKSKGAKRILPLQVHGAFHSGLMRTAEERLSEPIMQAPIQESSVAFAMNVPGDLVESIAEIRQNLIRQVTHSVRWEQSVRKMGEKGVDLFVEVGCGKTLSGFNKRIGLQAPTISVETVSEFEQFAKEIQ